MLAIQVENAFLLDNVALRDIPKPAPGPRQVLLKMSAASLNYRDLMIARGEYNPRWPLPLVLGSDGVGVVEALGSEASGVSVGDRVSSLVATGWHSGPLSTRSMKNTLGGPLPGVLQDYIVTNAEDLVHVPAHMTDVEAATLPCAALTAFCALRELGRPGETPHVLIQGTGGVALFAMQLAKLGGAKVLVVSGSSNKFERLRQLGVDLLLHRTDEPNWGRAAKDFAGGEGVDLVVDVGGADTLKESLTAVRPGGRIAVIGVLGGTTAEVDLRRLLMRNVCLEGVFLGSRAAFSAMNHELEAAELRPIVDRVFPITQALEALRYLESGTHFGKVCLSWDR